MVRSTSLRSLAGLALVAIFFAPAAHCLWPQPSSLTSGDKARSLSPNFAISIPKSLNKDKDMIDACQRALDRIYDLALKPYIPDRGQSLADQVKKSSPLTKLNVEINEQAGFDIHWNKNKIFESVKEFNDDEQIRLLKRGGKDDQSISALTMQPLEKLDESYELSVPDGDGVATLKAKNALGALRGLATFSQLVYDLPDESTQFIKDLPMSIKDKPAFPYRGLLLDTARNFLPVSSIKKQIDVMETVKLNQFHWHITDSQSFPLALKTKGMDIIAKTGAYAPKAVYDQKTVQEIIQYAASRGVNVIPEIDMPGHMRAGIEHYGKDELITCNAEKPWINWANEPPSGHLDIRKPAATQFAKDLFSEMATFFPGQYFGTGNDEINPHCFGLAKDDKAGADKLLKPFVDSVHSHLVDLKKTPVVWEEAVVDFPETGKILKPDSYVEAWISNKSVTSILQARKDVNIILAQVDFFYLDCGLGGWLSNDANGQSWCTYVTWQKQYSFDPFAGSEEIDGAEDRIKGGESAAWSEQIDSGNLDSVVWPRAAAGAEVFWTGASFNLNGKDTKRDLLEAEPRMHDVRGRIRAMGVLATPLQPFWCALNPGQCPGGPGLA